MSSNQTSALWETYLTNANANVEELAPLDKTLCANKCTLAGVVNLLGCSCAQRSYLAILYLSITTKTHSLCAIVATTDVGAFHLDEEEQATL